MSAIPSITDVVPGPNGPTLWYGPACGPCNDNGEDTPAVSLLPQTETTEDGDPSFIWVAVCHAHADGWWDGSDESEALHIEYPLFRKDVS